MDLQSAKRSLNVSRFPLLWICRPSVRSLQLLRCLPKQQWPKLQVCLSSSHQPRQLSVMFAGLVGPLSAIMSCVRLADARFILSASCNSTFGFMFESLPTLHNCYIFGNVTGNMSVSNIKFAQQLHYLDEGRNATAANVGQTLGTCLLKYCKTLPECGTGLGDNLPDPISFWSDFPSTSGAFGPYLVDRICTSIPARISSDVGGIGVSQPCSDRLALY